MKEYFLLQFRMINRRMADFGIYPALGYAVSFLAFPVLSALLFAKTEYAPYIFAVIALGALSGLSDPGRNDFLRTVFPQSACPKVRMAENLAVILPFALFLAYRAEWIPVLVMAALAPAMAVTRFGAHAGFTLPTPFGKMPFEFPVGFRNSWPVLLIAMLLAVMSCVAGNFNLGVFAQLLLVLTVFTFYLNPENVFYVWVFNLGPARFLAAKIRTAAVLSTLLCLPVIVGVGTVFPGQLLILLALQALCFFYLAAVILAKYASFPGQISLPLLVLLAVSVSFPPLLLALVPFLWIKSVTRLKEILA